MIEPRRSVDPTEGVPTEDAPTEDTPTKDAGAFERPLFNVFAEFAASQPDHLAVDDGTARMTYANLHDQALALGARIAALVPEDGLVGVLVPTSVLCPMAWLACLAARRTFLPLDPHLLAARNQAIVAEAGLAAVIVPATPTELTAWLPTGLARIPLTAEPDPQRLPTSPNLPPAKVGMVLFTSGSTGRPKGIALLERTALCKVMNYRATCGLGPRDGLLSLHPPPTGAGATDILAALLCGASLFLTDLKRDGLARSLALLCDSGITMCFAVPAVARALLAMDGAADAFRGLRIMRLAGDVIMDSDIAAMAHRLAPSARILIAFGTTETGGALMQRLIDPSAPIETGRVAMGTPVAGHAVSVEDANGNPARPGETGELVVRGRYVALGHWIGGQLDPIAFPADPAHPGSRCFRTGDMVVLRPDGMIVPAGRGDRQVKINGMRVEPADLETALRGLPDVADAAVLVHGTAAAPALVAFVVPVPAARVARTSAQLARGWRSALATRLPPQLIPARFHMVPAIPLLPSLKPDFAALRALLAAKDAPGMLAGVRIWLRGRRQRNLAVRVRSKGRPDGAAP